MDFTTNIDENMLIWYVLIGNEKIWQKNVVHSGKSGEISY